MSIYRVGWLTVALSLAVVGLGAAVVLLKGTLLTLMPIAVLGILVATLFVTDSAEAASWSRYYCRVCGKALLWGTAGCALAGFVALVGPIGLLVAVLLAATSPRALRAGGRGLGSLPRPTETQLDALARSLAYTNPAYVPFELALDLRLFTDDQLGKAWRDSQTSLLSPSSRRDLLRAVEERGRYLDEFERRHPSLLRAWLATDAGAPDSPLPYANASRLEPPTIDWDELTGGQATDR